MALKKFILPAIGAAVVAGGATAAYLYVFKGASGDALSPETIARYVPDEAYMAAYISTDAKTWAKLDQFGTPEARQLVEKGMADLQNAMAQDTQLNFEQDIRPWAGNIMVALMPAAEGGQSGEPQPLIVIAIKDKASALSFQNKVKNLAKAPPKESSHKGVTITSFTGEDRTMYAAVLDDYLVLSGNEATVTQAIDTQKGDPSFASSAGDTLTKPLDVQNPIMRIYIPDYAKAIQEIAASNPDVPALQPETLKQLQQVKSAVGVVGIDNAGIRLKARTTLDEQLANMEFQPAPGKVIAQFPDTTFSLVTGYGINQYWNQAKQNATQTPEGKQAVDQLRQQFQSINLDVDKDVFGWMDQEFALGLLQANEGFLAQVGFGPALVLGTSDRATAEQTLAKLDTLASGTGFITLGEREVNGKKLVEWRSPAGTFLGHTWLDDNSVLIAIGDPVISAMTSNSGTRLNDAEAFKKITGTLPKDNFGYFYLNMDTTMQLVNQVAAGTGSPVPPEAASVLNSIEGIGVTATRPSQTVSELELLLALKPAK